MRVIITGVTGQTGSYMVEYLLNQEIPNLKVYGVVRRLSQPNHDRITHIEDERFELITGDVTDGVSMEKIISGIVPDYFINLAANSFVGNSWDMPLNHIKTNFEGVLHQLEAIKKHAPHCRYYNAGTSEEVGDVDYSPQDEKHIMKPRSPYGVAKCAARHLIKVYRESYGMYAVQGRLYNHESERRGHEFVTRKITMNVARIEKALNENKISDLEPLELGNLDAKRDWSHAEDFVDGIWRMLNQEKFNENLEKIPYSQGSILLPFEVEKRNAQELSKHVKEYVLASNETHTVREFVELAFKAAGIDGVWWNLTGKPEDEEYILALPNGLATKIKVTLVKINPKFYRPAEVDLLWGDSTAARTELGWEPKVSFEELVTRMVKNDLKS